MNYARKSRRDYTLTAPPFDAIPMNNPLSGRLEPRLVYFHCASGYLFEGNSNRSHTFAPPESFSS